MDIDNEKLKEWMMLMAESMDRCSDNLEKLMIEYLEKQEKINNKENDK